MNLIADYLYAALIEVSISEFSCYRFIFKSLVLIDRQISLIGLFQKISIPPTEEIDNNPVPLFGHPIQI